MKTFTFMKGLMVFAIVGLMTVSTGAFAGLDYKMVKDIEMEDWGSSDPDLLTDVNGTLYFVTDSRGDGDSLWKTNGTKAGTVRVPLTADLRIYNMINVNGTLYMSVRNYDNDYDYELWKSNGTAAGTVVVRSFDDGEYEDEPAYIDGEDDLWAAVGNTLFFMLENDDAYAFELWKTDGTEAGTELVYVWDDGEYDDDGFEYFVARGDKIYFRVEKDDVYLPETDSTWDISQVWTSDGVTTEKIFDMRDRVVFGEFDDVRDITVAGNKVYFRIDDSYEELWMTDGTAEGTKLVEIHVYDDEIRNLTNVNGTLFYTTALDGDEDIRLLKVVKGKSVLVKAFDDHRDEIFELTAIGSKLYFMTYNWWIGWDELWVSNGTSSGTKVVFDYDEDLDEGLDGVWELEAAGGKLYILNYWGSELWVSNGKRSGTKFVHESDYGEDGIYDLTGSGSKLFFVDGEWNDDEGEYYWELYVTKGTEESTMVLDVTGTDSANPEYITNVNGTVYFVIDGWKLWKSDGTEAGTLLVYQGEWNIYDLINVNGTLFFTVDNGAYELWKTNGTEAGTVVVKSFDSGVYSSTPGDFDSSSRRLLATAGSTLYFMIENENLDEYQLWKSDGTEAGTVQIGSGFDGDAAGDDYKEWGFREFTAFGNNVIFSSRAWGTADEYELWISDGTTITKIFDTDTDWITEVTAVGNTLYFVEDGSILWYSDGTLAGTVQIDDPDANLGANLDELTNVSGTLFFEVENWPRRLCKVVGTDAKLVAEIDSSIRDLTAVKGKLFFFTDNTLVQDAPAAAAESDEDTGTVALEVPPVEFAHADNHDYELWTSNGTNAGTASIAQLYGENPDDATAVGGHLYFTFWTENHGNELWRSNGTTSGTLLAKDINQGHDDSYPDELTDVNGTLFFSAHDGIHGDELWKSFKTSKIVFIPKKDEGNWYDESFHVDSDGCSLGASRPMNLVLLSLVITFAFVASRRRRKESTN